VIVDYRNSLIAIGIASVGWSYMENLKHMLHYQ
jgi:hypothetical protein